MRPKKIFEQESDPGGPRESSWTDAGRSVREHVHYIRESDLSRGHQREMSFLRHLMLYDHTDERHQLEERLGKAERHERCARRAMWLMAVLTGLALAGLGYSAILLEDFPQNRTQLIIRIFCAIGLASLISLLAFLAFWLVSRAELSVHREECRRLVTRIIESRLGKPAGA